MHFPVRISITVFHNILNNKWIRSFLTVCFWLAVWEILAIVIGKEVLFASPLSVFRKLCGLLKDVSFYRDIVNSLVNILEGFLGALIVACMLSIFSLAVPAVYDVLSPFFSFVKATPVASFILIAFLVFGSQRLSVFISFLMALPVLYGNLTDGLRSVPSKELDAARVFNMRKTTRLRYIYLPAAVPYFLSGCTVSLGLSWKAGVAAEVIGLARFSLGERLYNAKLFLDTSEVFATTVVIVLMSWLTERLIVYFLKRLSSHIL